METSPVIETEVNAEFHEEVPVQETESELEAIPAWYVETLNLILANADLVGPCKWMGGQKVRLGTAMWKHERPTAENVHIVHANVVEFITNATKIDEEENPEETAEELEIEEENEKADVDLKKAASKVENKPQVKRPTHTEVPESVKPQPEKKPEPEAKKTNELTAKSFEVQPKPSPELEIKLAIETDKPPKPLVEIIEPKAVKLELTEDPIKLEPLPVEVKTDRDVIAPAQQELDTEVVSTEETEGEVNEGILVIEPVESPTETQVDAKDYAEIDQLEVIEPIDLVEEEIIQFQELDEVLEIDTETENIPIAQASETENGPQVEMDYLEATELSASVEEVENTIDELTIAIEACSQEDKEAAREILDKIAEVAAQVTIEGEDSGLSELEAEKEVEGLFIELLERFELEWTPEIIESLARLTVRGHLNKRAEGLKEQSADALAYDVGTHEIIVKIKAGLGWLKKAMANAWALGRSALQLCNYKFSTHVQLKPVGLNFPDPIGQSLKVRAA